MCTIRFTTIAIRDPFSGHVCSQPVCGGGTPARTANDRSATGGDGRDDGGVAARPVTAAARRRAAPDGRPRTVPPAPRRARGGARRGQQAAGSTGGRGGKHRRGGTGGAPAGTPTIFFLDVGGAVMTAAAENPMPRDARRLGRSGTGRHRRRSRRRAHLLDGDGQPVERRRLRAALEPGRLERRHAGARGRNVHAEADARRSAQRQAVLVGPRRDAHPALQHRRQQRRDAGDDRHRRDRSDGPEPLVRRHGARHRGRLVLLDAERRRQRRRRLDPPRAHPDAGRPDVHEPHRHRGAVQRAARADRHRARSRGGDRSTGPIAATTRSTARRSRSRRARRPRTGPTVRSWSAACARRSASRSTSAAAACTTPAGTASSGARTSTAATSRRSPASARSPASSSSIPRPQPRRVTINPVRALVDRIGHSHASVTRLPVSAVSGAVRALGARRIARACVRSRIDRRRSGSARAPRGSRPARGSCERLRGAGRPTPAQTATTGRSRGSSPRRARSSPSGRWRAPGMRPSSPFHSAGSRTSTTSTSARCSPSHSASTSSTPANDRRAGAHSGARAGARAVGRPPAAQVRGQRDVDLLRVRQAEVGHEADEVRLAARAAQARVERALLADAAREPARRSRAPGRRCSRPAARTACRAPIDRAGADRPPGSRCARRRGSSARRP